MTPIYCQSTKRVRTPFQVEPRVVGCERHSDHVGPHRKYWATGGHVEWTVEGAESKYYGWFEKEYNWVVEDARYRSKVLGEFPVEWPDVPTVQLELTVNDLKTIAYYMAEEEDADPTKAKIDKALKEML